MRRWRWALLPLLGLLAFLVGRALRSDAPQGSEEGRRLFELGLRADGRPTSALAYGDLPLTGVQVSCASCHGRSGMGAAETGTRTPPITGPMLFNPALRPRGRIYSEESLARALREGLDPDGRPLSPLMPRYQLEDGELRALAAYLRTLQEPEPVGIDEDHLYLATPISAEVPAEQREAVLEVLQTLVEQHNADPRNEEGRKQTRQEDGRKLKRFRRWSLEPWILEGPPDSWAEQLDERMERRPVFALLGGLSTQDWSPVQGFCEARRLPCLYPSLPYAAVQAGDFYTLHYSEGMGVEGRVMARELLAAGAAADVVQVLHPEDAAAAGAAAQVAEALARGGGSSRLTDFDELPAEMPGASAVLLWLPGEELSALPRGLPPQVWLSGTRLGEPDAELPEELDGALIADAWARHRGPDKGLLNFRAWASRQGIAPRHERLQAEAWFAATALLDGMMHIGLHPGGTYLLDTLDHATGLAALLPGYPEAGFGPGQRAASKGAWVRPARGGEARWVQP